MKLSHYEQEMVIRGLLLLADAYRGEGVVLGGIEVHKKREAEEVARSLSQESIVGRFKITHYRDSDSRGDVTTTEHHWKVTDPVTGLFEDGEAIGLTHLKAKEASIARLLSRVLEKGEK